MKYTVTAPDHGLFYSRQDPKDPRLGELIDECKYEEFSGADVVILGIPEDRGIAANKGRTGAAQAPDGIRRRLYRLTPGFDMDLSVLKVCDIGNLNVEGLSIEEVHLAAQALVRDVVKAGAIPIVLGGSHDLTYPGLAGFAEGNELGEDSMGLINVDSHLDVRTDDYGINSGTPFYRALTQLTKDALKGDSFVEFGIQEPYNSPYYYNWVCEQGGTVMTLKEISGRVMESFLQALTVASKRGHLVALSLDIDSVRSTDAPGASASNPSGFKAPEIDKIAYLAGRSSQVRYFDIMEVSPPLDQDFRTTSLAALSIFWFLKGVTER